MIRHNDCEVFGNNFAKQRVDKIHERLLTTRWSSEALLVDATATKEVEPADEMLSVDLSAIVENTQQPW